MFRYFCHLYLKHRKPILPIAVFSYDEPRDEPDTFHMTFPFFDTLRFHFLPIVLKKRNWRDFLKQNNPIAAALMAKMGYNEDEKVQMKKEFMRMMITFELNEAKSQMLMGFFESYLVLNEDEERQFQKEIKNLVPEEATRIMEITTSWHKKGREEGREEGRKKGQVDLICKFLTKRFGKASSNLQDRVRRIDNLDSLNTLSDQIFLVQTIDEAARVVDEVLEER
jgi:flagellar biosynthesis/type III secretory pathway protein FliH